MLCVCRNLSFSYELIVCKGDYPYNEKIRPLAGPLSRWQSVAASDLSLHPDTATAEPRQKATWFWDTPQIQDSADDILNFAASQGVNVLYLQMNRDVRPEYYRAFIRQAGDQESRFMFSAARLTGRWNRNVTD